MGSWWSSSPSSSDVEEISQVQTPNPFKYPPKSGTYFSTHFIMGGEKFETPQPEQYLFGDNADLNFLGSKPVPFPYPAPASNEPTKPLKALIYIRKESLKFVKIPDTPSYNIEFTFDADCRCQITIMYFCFEEVTASGVTYRPRDPKMSSEPLRFKAGASQQFALSDHTFTPSDHPEADLQYDYDQEIFPIVIHCVTLEGDEQSHTTTAFVDKHGEDTYVLKPLKQKLFVDGLGYLLQEIYGIENKRTNKDEDEAENATECVICMSDARDTLILPCKHLCLCHSCGDSLRYQASNCPICRAPFRALLQIRAVYRIPPAPFEYPSLPPDMPVIQMNAIPGYEMVPLLEALNSPYQPSDLSSAAASLAVEAARVLSNDDTANEELPTNCSVPIAMQVMVKSNSTAPIEPKYADDDDEAEAAIKEVDEDGDDGILKNVKEELSESSQSTPVRHSAKLRLGSSLPVTPNLTIVVSGASTRSSGDSFTSSCSTKQLLTTAQQQS